MKIKRFTAPDMRAAMRAVREEQGPEAVILSNRRVDDHVEVVAAVDYDESLVQQALRQAKGRPERGGDRPRAARPDERAAEGEAPARSQVGEPDKAPRREHVVWAQDPHIHRLQSEIQGMRKTLERQVGSLVWQDWSTRQPHRADAVRELTELGIERRLACELARDLPEPAPGARAPRPASLLCQRLRVAKDEPIGAGGVIALVGPTGVGKTTTVAKLAARYAERHELRDIALVTTDGYRIGAREQLFTYGQLLGVPVFTAADRGELESVLAKLSDRKLVLIDTAGMSPRDTRLASQFGVLEGAHERLRSYLVLAANAQPADLNDVVHHFRATPLSGCILTKLDEAARLGGALSAAIRHELSVAYVADGQRVPEDLHRERPDQLILRALRVMRERPEVRDLPIEEAIHACA